MFRLVSIVAAVTVAFVMAGCGGSGNPSPSTVADAAGAVSCDNSGFYGTGMADGKKHTIYDCMFAGQTQPACVAYVNGIAKVVTDEVRAGFEGVTNGKPACVGGDG